MCIFHLVSSFILFFVPRRFHLLLLLPPRPFSSLLLFFFISLAFLNIFHMLILSYHALEIIT